MADKKQLQIVLRMKDMASKELKKVQGVAKGFGTSLSGMFKGIAKTVFSLKGAVIGLIGALAIRKVATSFVEVASTTEQLGIRLRVLLGDVKEANLLFAELTEFAGRVPFEYREIMESATMLSGIMKDGRKEIMEWLPLIGDLAAATGLSIQVASEQVMRMLSAGASAADRFRERGVLGMLGFTAGVAYTVEETRVKLMSAWKDVDSKFRGSTKLLASSWAGTMSMLADAWFNFRDMVMKAGLFDFIKEGAASVMDTINELKESGELKEYAKSVSDAVLDAMDKIVSAVTWFWNIAKEIHIFLKTFKYEIISVGAAFIGITIVLPKVIALVVMLQTVINPVYALMGIFGAAIVGVTAHMLTITEEADSWAEAQGRVNKELKATDEELKLVKQREYAMAIKKVDDALYGLGQAADQTAYEHSALVQEYYELTKGMTSLAPKAFALTKEYQGQEQAMTFLAFAAERLTVSELAEWFMIIREELALNLKAIDDVKKGYDSFWAGMGAGFTGYVADAKTAFKLGEEAAKASAKAMGSAMSNMFFDVITTKVGNAKEHFRKFLLSILKMVTDLMAQKVMISFLSSFMKGGGKAPAAGETALGAPGDTKLSIGAKGGVAPGGFKAFQGGGIVNQPTFGLVGEGKQNEAIVPLPDNKSIPVTFKGGGEEARDVNVNFNIMTNDAAGFSALLVREKNTIQGIIAEAMRSNRDFRKVMA